MAVDNDASFLKNHASFCTEIVWVFSFHPHSSPIKFLWKTDVIFKIYDENMVTR